jgi:hypothetical protein
MRPFWPWIDLVRMVVDLLTAAPEKAQCSSLPL